VAFTGLSLTHAIAIADLVGYDIGQPVPHISAEIIQVRARRLAADGTTSDRVEYRVRDDRGEFLVVRLGDGDQTFDPPALLLPSDLTAGQTWSTEGSLPSGAGYSLRGLATNDDARPTECLRV
jgi:hypothetical protein